MIEKLDEFLRASQLSENTARSYRRDITKFIQFMNLTEDVTVGDLSLVTYDDVYRWMESMQENNSANSVHRRIAALHSFYKYLNDKHKDKVKEIPTEGIKKPKLTKKVMSYTTEDLAVKLLKLIKESHDKDAVRDYLIFNILLHTGLRASELLNIDISDIEGDEIIVHGKGDKQRRIILPECALKALKEYYPIRLQILTNTGKKTDALVLSRRGDRLSYRMLYDIVKKKLKLIKKGNLSPHSLRHSCFSNLVKHGENLRLIQELAGHSNIIITERYTHVDIDSIRRAVNNTKLAQI